MKRKYRKDMTEAEWAVHVKELSRQHDRRRQERKNQRRREMHAQESPEEREARLQARRVRESAARRRQGMRPRVLKDPIAKREYKVAWARQKRQELRNELMARYGGACMCCGVSDVRWLSLHHKNGNGGEERRELTGGKRLHSMKRLRTLVDQPARDDLVLLCYNCHLALEFFGLCPHNDPASPAYIVRA